MFVFSGKSLLSLLISVGIIGMFGYLIIPMVRSVSSKLVNEDEQGTVDTAVLSQNIVTSRKQVKMVKKN